MPTYSLPTEEATALLAKVARSCAELSDLVKAEVKVGLCFAYGDQPAEGDKKPAIMHRGIQADGLAELVNLKRRSMGEPDCIVTIDADWWETARPLEREALLHHELYHFEVERNDEGNFKPDKAGRPKLKMRKHEVEVGWFVTTAARYGKDSGECRQFRRICERDGAALLPAVFGTEIAHSGDTLTLTRPDGTQVTIPAEDLARVHAAEDRQVGHGETGGTGITSMTFTGGGSSVTITAKDAKEIMAGCDAVLADIAKDAAGQ